MDTIERPVTDLRMPTYHLQTFGCQMNEYDSELIRYMLEQRRYVATEQEDDADVAIFNTCCIRDNADQKVYGRLGEFKRFKSDRPQQVLAIAGCLAQKDGEKFLERFPQVDVVVGTHNLQDLPDLIDRVQRGEGRFVKVDKTGDHFALPANPKKAFNAMVTISMGCDQWCTFCVVPYVRGRLRSRPIDQVVSEVRRLAADGHREVMLLGQNVNDYGRDLGAAAENGRAQFADLLGGRKGKEGAVHFGTLLDDLRGVPNLDRLRWTSPHPAYFTQDVIDSMAANPSVCEHVHMPVQSGDDEVLQRMKRGYTAAQYLDLVERIRKAIPTSTLTTDLIVGFPGETEQQFENTMKLVREVRFKSAFMFAYSPRPKTPGALFEDQIPEEVRLDRLYRLIELQNTISWEDNQKTLGRTLELLVEGPSKKDAQRLTGRDRCGRLCHFNSERDLTGQLVRVRLTEGFTWGFLGSLVEAEPERGAWRNVDHRQPWQ